MDLKNNTSFSSYAYFCLECHIAAFSEECVAKLVHGLSVATLLSS